MIFARCGVCSHSLLVSFLEGEKDVSLANPEAFTKKHAPSDVGEADESLRQELRGRKVQVPPRSAWSTMAQVFELHRRRQEEQAKKGDAAQAKVWKLFNDGCTGDVVEEPLQQGQQRQKALLRIQKNLASNVFREMFAALIAVESLAVTLPEGRDLKIVHFIHAKKNTPCPGDPPIVAVLAGRTLRRWAT